MGSGDMDDRESKMRGAGVSLGRDDDDSLLMLP